MVAVLLRRASRRKGRLKDQPGRDFSLPVPGGLQGHGVRDEGAEEEAQAESEPGYAEVLPDPCRADLRQAGLATLTPPSRHRQHAHISR